MSATGFIGIGIMGEGMAARLLSENVVGTSSDSPLVIWNRTTKKCESLKKKFPEKFIEIKESPCEVVKACGVTYSMLSTPEVSKEVFFASNGVLAGIGDGKSIVDCATLAEKDMVGMNEAVVAKGGRFLEAPVSGSKVPAATGALIFLCAGSQDLFNEIAPTGLAAMGKASHFLNTQVGYGTRAKLVVNSLMGTMVAAYGESLALTESLGLDGTKMIEIISQGAIASPVYALKGPKMLVNDHAPNFPLKHAHKDMALACNMAKDAGVNFKVNEKAEEVFRKAREDKDADLADLDFSAVFEEILKGSTSEYAKKRQG